MKITSSQNPWLEIPAADYEAHMGSPEVGQLQLLNHLFKQILEETLPKNVAVLGCTTGNGFEHFDLSVTRHILGVDINPQYLRIAAQRFSHFGNCLELKCLDLQTDSLGEDQYDLIHAALIFEYVYPQVVLKQIGLSLTLNGILSVVLQQPNSLLPAVSKTPFTSLEKLAPIFHHLSPDQFSKLASHYGFYEVEEKINALPSGKEFFIGKYRKQR
ncbi:MAG: class I SAM-dependent methyltransferase [Anaerolineaceae bacterium]|nr:class I SAM-dependent methyltransferase [Anaerolineaceae bacterium]